MEEVTSPSPSPSPCRGKVNSGSLGRFRERRDWRGWGVVDVEEEEEAAADVEEGVASRLEDVGDGVEGMIGDETVPTKVMVGVEVTEGRRLRGLDGG